MPSDYELRAIVKTFVGGYYDSSKLDRVFLWARDHANDYPAVRDLGDFVAHSGERDAGMSWQHANNTFTNWRLSSRLERGEKLNKGEVETLLQTSMAIEDKAYTLLILGQPQQQAQTTLKKALKRLVGVDGHDLILEPPANAEEAKVIAYYHGHRFWKPVINSKTLYKEFTSLLLNKGILKTDEKNSFKKISDYLSVYALARMHATKLIFTDCDPATLLISKHPGEDGVMRFTLAACQWNAKDNRGIKFTIFETDLLYCERYAWSAVLMFIDQEGTCIVPVEIDDKEMKLNPIVLTASDR